MDLNNKPLFNTADIIKLREVRYAAMHDMHYLDSKLPEISGLPDSVEIENVHQSLSRYAELEAAIHSCQLPPLVDATTATMTAVSLLLDKVKRLLQISSQLQPSQQWHSTARQWLKNPPDNFAELIEIFDGLNFELKQAIAEQTIFLQKPIILPVGAELNDELIQAIKNKSMGKSAFGFMGLIGKATAKQHLDEIRILTSAPETDADWQHVHAYLILRKRFLELVIRWNRIAPELAMAYFETSEVTHVVTAAEYHASHILIREQIDLHKQVENEVRFLLPTWKNHADIEYCLENLLSFLESHLLRYRLSSALMIKNNLQKALSAYSGKIVDDFKAFNNAVLGNLDTADSEIQSQWSSLIAELKRLNGLKRAFSDIHHICQCIEQSGAQQWAHQLRTQATQSTLDMLLPDNWQAAWRLRRLATYLEKADARHELKKLAAERLAAETQLAKTYREIVAKLTWLKLAEKATPNIRAALNAFLNAVGKIGKGLGKKAVIARQEARVAAERANSAVPCWIMPHWRVSEALPAQLGCFDLVIIDEASQSDFAALPALLRAQKILIVGDDKQVSPDGSFIDVDKVQSLKNKYLNNQVDIFRNQMNPGQSLYDLFKVVFESNIMLREHFRSVGAIIEYSKREIYDHQLKPMRLPKASERLDPPLVDVLVEDGLREKDSNPAEARFIVDEIKKICADNNMSRRTIGVVCLHGNKQALDIFTLLMAELSQEEINRHEIACGDAPTFQGKERDIMFLSMVISGKTMAQTQELTIQRLNVAASRARDRMYLVRSVEIDQLSSADIFRRKLIEHFSAPFMQDEQRVENARTLCESDFEREVYDLLIERGYRVIPQVKVGEYRIDMVVEGLHDTRLAIECDGDRYHGIDQWEKDIQRQRVLERAGWEFWRCFASHFVRNRQEVIIDLIHCLSKSGIEPIGSDAAPRSIHTEFRRVIAFPLSLHTKRKVDHDSLEQVDLDFC